MTELEDLLRLQDVAQAVLTQRLESHRLGQCVARKSGDGVAEQNLLTVGRVEQTRQPVQAGGEIVAVTRLGCPGVKGHAHARPLPRARPRLVEQSALRVERRGDASWRGGEGRLRLVADRLEVN